MQIFEMKVSIVYRVLGLIRYMWCVLVGMGEIKEESGVDVLGFISCRGRPES